MSTFSRSRMLLSTALRPFFAGLALCASLPALAAAPTFDIYEYVIDGNSVLGEEIIENTMAPFLGEGKTLKDVDGARAALEDAYHKAGYLTVLVTIPEQGVDTGTVALHVTEGGVDKLRVVGAQYTLPSEIKAKVPELAEGNVPNFNKVQEQLNALNRNADVKVTPILRAGTLPGTVEVQLDADDQLPLHGSVEYSNRQTPNTTASRLSASLRYDNLFQRGQSLGLTIQTSPERSTDARVLAANYLIPVGSAGDAVTISGVHSRSEFASLANAPGLGLLGNSDSLGLRYATSLAAGIDYAHSLSAGLDHKRVGQDLLLSEGGGSSSLISYTPAVVSYSGRSFDAERNSGLDATLTAGLRGLLGNHDDAFAAKRLGASASFMALRTSVQHTESLGHWSLIGKLDFQLASGPLVSNEQFSAGGAESVRGYREGERTGDGGARISVEVRTPQWRPGGVNSDWSWTGLAFFDAARLHTQQVVAPQPANENMRGTGLGMRMTAPRGLALEVDAARALVDGDGTRSGDKRVHARAVWGF